METSQNFNEPSSTELAERIITIAEVVNEVVSSTHGDILIAPIMRLRELRESIVNPPKDQHPRKTISHWRDFIFTSTEIKNIIIDLGTDDNTKLQLSYLVSALKDRLQQTITTPTQNKTKNPSNNIEDELASLKREFFNIKSENSKEEARISKLVKDTESKLASLQLQTNEINTQLHEEITKAETYHDTIASEINEKHSQINSILGIASSDVLSGDHGKNAAAEEKTANRLRNLSVGCMLIILGVLGFTVWESTKSTFSWDVALFRVSIAFLLSVPAAYLARESAKHREQQYYYRQTALNLKAISPYIASLPDEEQHKLKIEIASKIFSGREASKFEGDSYPINIQEILIALLSKIETPQKKH